MLIKFIKKLSFLVSRMAWAREIEFKSYWLAAKQF